MFPRSVRILTLWGFDIKVDPSWLVIAALITWSLGQQVFPELHPDLGGRQYYAMALTAMVLFFASLVAHEIAHSLVARRYGVHIKGITLFIFGGVAELSSEPKTPISEFWIAIAGPIMSVLLSFFFLFWSIVLSGVGPVTVVMGYLSVINLILALFNLLPAFPLDGGRILRAYLWYRNQDLLEATRTATNIGALFAYAIIALGVVALFSGNLVGGFWQILIGTFLLAAARSTYQSQMMTVGLAGQTVGSLMSTNVAVAEPAQSLSNLVNRVMLPRRTSFVPVQENGVLLGYVDSTILAEIDRENWSATSVGDVFCALDEDNCIPPSLSAQDLMTRMLQNHRRKFLVVEGDVLVGVITLADLTGYLDLLQRLHVLQSSRFSMA